MFVSLAGHFDHWRGRGRHTIDVVLPFPMNGADLCLNHYQFFIRPEDGHDIAEDACEELHLLYAHAFDHKNFPSHTLKA